MLKTIKVIIACLCLSACALQPINVDIEASPEKDEKATSILEERIGHAGFQYVTHYYKLVDDFKTLNRLNRIGARIAAFTERPQIHYTYIIIDSVYREAFSMPNGYIVFTNSFIESFDQDDMLAAVIAHEIAHVTHKHAVTEYYRIIGRSIIIGEKVFYLATDIHLRQAYEFQADLTGIRYLYWAGYSPDAFLHLLDKLKITEKEDMARLTRELELSSEDITNLNKQLVSSHPNTESRIVTAESYIQEIIKTEEVKYDPELFQF